MGSIYYGVTELMDSTAGIAAVTGDGPDTSTYEENMTETIQFRLNGQPQRLVTDAGRTLLWVLRTDLGLTGTKYGCGEGLCGSCAVVIDGVAARSCQLSLADVRGKAIVTIEGLADGERDHPLQAAFAKRGALQCGFCTPGMIMNAYGLLQENKKPSRQEIVDAMDDNLCRCGAHKRIIEAIEAAAGRTGT